MGTLNGKRIYYWLNERSLGEIPVALSQDLESQAVERFFTAWTLFPCNDGLSPGHMHELPMLYSSAAPDSILWHALRAMAFADMRHHYIGALPFHHEGIEALWIRVAAAAEHRGRWENAGRRPCPCCYATYR